MYKKIGSAIGKMNRLEATLGGALVALIGILISADIVTRTIRSPMDWLIPVTTQVFIVVVFLGMGECEANRAHPRVDFLPNKIGGNAGQLLNVFAYVLAVLLVGIIFWRTSIEAIESTSIGEYILGIGEIPVYPSKIAIALGFLAYFLQLIVNSIEEIKKLKDPK